jgi:hypothetical protein
MNTVTIGPCKVSRALELVDELKQSGMTPNCEFEWRYRPMSWDNMTGAVNSQVTFEFQDSALATFYQLKWARS